MVAAASQARSNITRPVRCQFDAYTMPTGRVNQQCINWVVCCCLQRGQAPLSDLQCTTSSEALLCGKAPTFRLLVWAIDRHGNHLQNITYVVSENFVVATKRVKHAIKSDIPSVADHISKLVHIGKATVDKLMDLRQAAAEENLEVDVPDDLNRVEKVGQFQQLVEMTEVNSDLKHKLRHLLKLSPEKWEEVAQHAMAAVVPDFRPRVWWCPTIHGGLLFSCKNGAIIMEHPIALVTRGAKEGEETVVSVHQLDPMYFNLLPKLKQQALQDWYAPGHHGWAIYWKDTSDPLAQQMQPGQGPLPLPFPGANGSTVNPIGLDTQMMDQKPPAVSNAAVMVGNVGMGGLAPTDAVRSQQQTGMQMGHQATSPSGMAGAGVNTPFSMGPPAVPSHQQQHHQQQQQQQQQMQPPSMQPQQAAVSPQGTGNLGRSPFATQSLQNTVSDAFPPWMVTAQQASQSGGARPMGMPANVARPQPDIRQAGAPSHFAVHAAAQPPASTMVSDPKLGNLPSLEMINTDDLPTMDRGSSLWSLNSLQEMQMLVGELPSVGVANLLAGSDHQQGMVSNTAAPAGAPDGVQVTEGMDRALSLKFSMSLDLADMPELKGQ